LKGAGYRLIRRFENNGWYVPDGAQIGVGLRERWDIVRKYYLGLPFRIARNASRALRRRWRSQVNWRPGVIRPRLARDCRRYSLSTVCAGLTGVACETSGRRSGGLVGGVHACMAS
jgi:hypothetical protein